MVTKSEGFMYNPSFDVTPVESITAIVTEKGVAAKGDRAFDLNSVAYYPRIHSYASYLMAAQ